MRKLLKLAERAKESPLVIRMERLRGKVRIETYTDASFGNIKDGISQVGLVVGIRDEWGGRYPIFWKSRKGQRVARSTIEAKTISLNEGLKMVIHVKEMWEELSGVEEVKMIGKTDSQTLEKAIKSATGMRSRKFQTDLASRH